MSASSEEHSKTVDQAIVIKVTEEGREDETQAGGAWDRVSHSGDVIMESKVYSGAHGFLLQCWLSSLETKSPPPLLPITRTQPAG